jgi:hypothetical protein
LSFATQLEYDYFPPDNDENELYQIFQLLYCGMPYYIVEIPRHSYQVAENLAKNLSLKMVNGKPTSANSPPFGLLCSADACFTLETIHELSDPASWTYQLKDEQIRIKERLKMTRVDIDNEQEDN